VVSGATAFRLYDTFGFPLDLTVLMAEEKNMTVDCDAYEIEMEKARETSR
jgi:alanyl-tRNA synthetase